jgi:Innexin
MVCCEILNLANLLLQIYLTHIFLGRRFLTLGIDVLRDDFNGIMDTLDVVFPKVTKCHFHKYGASGSIQKHDGEFCGCKLDFDLRANRLQSVESPLSFVISVHSSLRDGTQRDKREDFHRPLVLVLRADGGHNLIAAVAIADALSPLEVNKSFAVLSSRQSAAKFVSSLPDRPPSTASCFRSHVPAR